MAELTTDRIIRHTLHLAPEELGALRKAAKAALGAYLDAPDAEKETWQAFITLGTPATRGGRTFVEQYSNPHMIGTTPGP